MKERFPILSRVDPETWMAIPGVFLITLGVLVGIVTAIFEVPKTCNPCHDEMMKRYDAFLCTGKPSLPHDELVACRRKLGKPAVY